MEITDVRVRLASRKRDKVKAFASVTFDSCFVVRNIRLIEGNNGLFLAMPSEEARKSCPQCTSRIPWSSRFCPRCGAHLGDNAVVTSAKQGSRDLAHPINQETREYITSKVIEAYNEILAEAPPLSEEVEETEKVEEKEKIEEVIEEVKSEDEESQAEEISET
ncbi:MAG: hypothetical protein GXO71_07980 [Caldiserica bacterium]|nr:hypothetical protein [Caldisericota bacterium]